MEKQRVSFTEQIRIALSKPLWYKSLFQQSLGQHIGYFLILLMLVTVIQCVIPMAAYIQSIGGLEAFVYQDIPEFSISDGKLLVSSVVDYESTGVRIIIDTSREQFRKIDADSVAAGMSDTMPIVYLVSQTNIICNTIPTAFPISSLNLTYDNNRLYQDLPLFITGYIVFFILKTAVSYLISALFFSLFGALMNKALGLKIKFGQILLIALYAKSVEIILEAILEVLGISLLYYVGTIIGIFITCRYMTRGMSSLVLKIRNSDDEDKGMFTDFFV